MLAVAPRQAQARPESSLDTKIAEAAFSFGPQQDSVMRKVSSWFKFETKTRPVFYLFGYAGTGKTTLARYLAAEIGGDVCFAAYTGKASLMLRRSGCKDASTIHKAMYIARRQRDGSFRLILNRDGSAAGAKLIVIDECSMVDAEIGKDLLSLGIPILVLGDPAQLPPVKSAGFFTDIDKPDAMLTEIHRQAADNPIIRVATAVREGRALSHGSFGTVDIIRPGERSVDDVVKADQIIVGRNATREAFNARIRKHRGHKSPYPVIGDKLVCLRNDRDLGIFNGGLFTVDKILNGHQDDVIPMMISSEDDAEMGAMTANVLAQCFDGDIQSVTWKKRRERQEFTYGYALTCHKAQGSQWDHVMVYDESQAFETPRQWLYTAVTRASERLTLVM